MKFLTLTLMLITANTAFPSNSDLICSGRKCTTSPYPGAGGCSNSFFRANLNTDNAKLNLPGKFFNMYLSYVGRNAHSGKVEIQGSTVDGERVDLELSVLGSNGPHLKGKIGNHKVNFRCNRNLVINL